MTNQEVITKLTNIMNDDHYSWHPSVLEAFRMAVDALRGLPSAQPTHGNTSNALKSLDCIDRQAAIDRAVSIPMFGRDVKMVAVSEIKNLPSAQPEQRWIPWDSGEFPEESGTYTVTAYDGVTKRVTYAKYQKRLKRWELTGARAYWRVLAWMPLPEPYREGDAE